MGVSIHLPRVAGLPLACIDFACKNLGDTP